MLNYGGVLGNKDLFNVVVLRLNKRQTIKSKYKKIYYFICILTFELIVIYQYQPCNDPVDKITEKTAFLTTWHCISSAENFVHWRGSVYSFSVCTRRKK